jgi:flavorubredoxin
MMATVAAFLCYLRGLTPRGMKPGDRIGIPFGSYGWAPAGPSEVADELARIGYTNALGTFAHAWAGDEAYLDDLRAQVAEGVDKVRAGDFGETAAE